MMNLMQELKTNIPQVFSSEEYQKRRQNIVNKYEKRHRALLKEFEKNVEKEGKIIPSAKTGDKVAISMEEPTIGRQMNEGDILMSVITRSSVESLKEIWDRLHDDEKQLLKEWKLV